MRSMVEGAHVSAPRDDSGYDPVEVAQDIARRNAHHGKSFFAQEYISRRVVPWLVTAIMTFAVDLDNQAMTQTRKIHGDLSDGKLRPKLQSIWTTAERLEQDRFGQGQQSAQFASALDSRDWHLENRWAPSTKFHLVPLPVPGRNAHIRNTPKRALSSIGALKHAANASPSTSLVWAGSMMPSSHRRAVACHGLPCAS